MTPLSPLEIEEIRGNLVYVFSRKSFWSNSVGHFAYLQMVRSTSNKLAVFMNSRLIADYNAFLDDCQAY